MHIIGFWIYECTGVHNSQVLGALGSKTILPTGAKIDNATGDLMDVVIEGREI